MGSGKTSIGKILSEALNLPFLDLDSEIEKEAKKSIPEIFNTKGEIYFRKLENQTLKKLLASNDSFVLATGGGTPCYGDSLNAMKQTDGVTTIYLRTPISVLSERLFIEKENRPLVSHIETEDKLSEFIGIHLFERSHFYNQADIIIDTGKSFPNEVVQKIREALL